MKPDLTPVEKFLIAGPMILIAVSGLLWQLVKAPSAAPEQRVQVSEAFEEHQKIHAQPEIKQSETNPQEIESSKTETHEVTQTETNIQIPMVGARTLEFSPDGERLVVIAADATKPVATAGVVYDLVLGNKVCDLASPALMKGQGAGPSRLYPPVWSPDGTLLASVVNSETGSPFRGQLVVWEAGSGKKQVEQEEPFHLPPMFGNSGRPSPLRFAADSKTLGTEFGGMEVVDIATGKAIPSTNFRGRPDLSSANRSFSNAEELGLSLVQEWEYKKEYATKRFGIIEAKSRRSVWEPKIRGAITSQWYGDIVCVAENRDNVKGKPRVANHLLLWNARTRQQLPSPPLLAQASIGEFSFNPDQSTLVYFVRKRTQGQPDKWGELVVWNYRKNRVVWRTETNAIIREPRWSPDGKWLVAVGYGIPNMVPDTPFSLLVYDNKGQLRYERQTTNRYHRWSPDGKQLAVIVMGEGKAAFRQSKSVEVQRF